MMVLLKEKMKQMVMEHTLGQTNGHGTLYTTKFLGFKITKQGQWRNDEFIE